MIYEMVGENITEFFKMNGIESFKSIHKYFFRYCLYCVIHISTLLISIIICTYANARYFPHFHNLPNVKQFVMIIGEK